MQSCRRLVITGGRGTGKTTLAAREQFAESSASAIALVGETPVDRLLAAFALSHGDARVPAQYFTEESDAIAWLLTALPPPP